MNVHYCKVKTLSETRLDALAGNFFHLEVILHYGGRGSRDDIGHEHHNGMIVTNTETKLTSVSYPD